MPKRRSNLASQVRKRDNHICQVCGFAFQFVEVHHIHPLIMGGPDAVNNMISLCRDCHTHSPNDPEKFLGYQRLGGPYWWKFAAEQGIELTVALRWQMFGMSLSGLEDGDEWYEPIANQVDMMLEYESQKLNHTAVSFAL